mgnify:CR=1 FL=1
MHEQLIELYCQTGRKQAERLFREVIKNTELPFRKESLNISGCWTWCYDDIDEKIWKRALPVLKKKITELFINGIIISGKWGY